MSSLTDPSSSEFSYRTIWWNGRFRHLRQPDHLHFEGSQATDTKQNLWFLLLVALIWLLTRPQIYLVGFDGSKTVELTTFGEHGATHAPVFNRQGDKVAWLQLDEDGHESDR